MSKKELRKSMQVLPLGTVMELTGLTPRQIRYYEEHQLVIPKRSATNRRLYSLNDIDKLLDIKEYLDEGLTIKAIKNKFQSSKTSVTTNGLTDEDVRRILYQELLAQQEWRHRE